MKTETRSGTISGVRASGDEELTFPLSSEEPVRTWYGIETLSHSPDAVDMSFINGGTAPLITNHNVHGSLDNVIGVVTKAWLQDSRLYVTVRFSSRDTAQAIKRDVEDGILKNVSVGYEVNRTERDEDSEEYLVTKWRPTEASIVAVPADTSVGVGRSKNQTENQMPKEEKTNASIPARTDVIPVADVEKMNSERGAEIAAQSDEIHAVAAAHSRSDLAAQFIGDAMRAGEIPSFARFQAVLRKELPEGTPVVSNDIGLTKAEKRQFSIMNVVRTLTDNPRADVMERAAFELEACNAAADQVGHTGGRMVLPVDLMDSWNDFEVDGVRSSMIPQFQRAAIATGGNPNVQSDDHLASRFIDNLRNQSSVLRAGVTVLGGLSGNIEIPGGDANATSTWLSAEDEDADETVPTFRIVTMSVKDIAGYTDITRRMIQQSTVDIEMYVRNQLLMAQAEGIDLAGLSGAGTGGVPEGITQTAGIGSVTFGAAVPTRGEVIDLRTAIATTNRGRGVTYLGNSALVGDMQQLPTDAGSGTFVMNDNADRLVGNGFIESNAVTDGDLIAGVWSDMLLGLWGGLELDRDTSAKFLSGGIRLRAIQSADFGVTRVGSFAVGNDGV